MSLSEKIHRLYGRAAARAMQEIATLAEDKRISKNFASVVFCKYLQHKDPYLRVVAAESIWQIADHNTIPYLTAQLRLEKHSGVKATIEYVLKVFDAEITDHKFVC